MSTVSHPSFQVHPTDAPESAEWYDREIAVETADDDYRAQCDEASEVLIVAAPVGCTIRVYRESTYTYGIGMTIRHWVGAFKGDGSCVLRGEGNSPVAAARDAVRTHRAA